MERVTKQSLFGELDFQRLHLNPSFKEDSVREVIVLPLLMALGYSQANIIRSMALKHPFLRIGSKKRPITLVPDYTLRVDGVYPWVLDAKTITEAVMDADNIEQVYSYSSHPEIRSTYFAICNGLQFALFRREFTNQPLLLFEVDQLEFYWDRLRAYVSPDSFHFGKSFTYENTGASIKNDASFDYAHRPLLNEIPVKKQQAKRHFGVHGYFTKQSWNVVSEYIKNYTKPGDLVLDPFGGSGITLVEALMTDRRAIHVDLNPMSVFMTEGLIAPVKISELVDAFSRIKQKYEKSVPHTAGEMKKALSQYSYPHGDKLPKGSDVRTVEQLFTRQQLAQLALLKHLIAKEKDAAIRKSLLLAFSSTVTKINRTYHNSGQRIENAGDCAAFRYYRYRIARTEVQLDVWTSFETKFRKLLNAKQEIQPKINTETIGNASTLKASATDLHWLANESVDYIYTDPPYGKKIPYLDLSVMWNAWLDLKVTRKDRQLEAIEGGDDGKTKFEYNSLMAASIREMYILPPTTMRQPGG